MKKLMLVALLTVIPSALWANISSLQEAEGDMTAARLNKDAVIAHELAAKSFDNILVKNEEAVVVADNDSTKSDKKTVPLAVIGSKKTILASSVPAPESKNADAEMRYFGAGVTVMSLISVFLGGLALILIPEETAIALIAIATGALGIITGTKWANLADGNEKSGSKGEYPSVSRPNLR